MGDTTKPTLDAMVEAISRKLCEHGPGGAGPCGAHMPKAREIADYIGLPTLLATLAEKDERIAELHAEQTKLNNRIHGQKREVKEARVAVDQAKAQARKSHAAIAAHQRSRCEAEATLATERAEGERLRVLRDNAMNLLECGFPGMGRWTAAQRKLYESIVTVAPWPDCPCSPGDGTTRCLFETACQDKAAALDKGAEAP